MRQTDRQPGEEDSLRALYAAVPSAEELDLADEADHDRRQAPGAAALPTEPLVLRDEPGSAEASDPDEEITPLTDGQARGVLEQLLGVEPVEDAPADGSDEDEGRG